MSTTGCRSRRDPNRHRGLTALVMAVAVAASAACARGDVQVEIGRNRAWAERAFTFAEQVPGAVHTLAIVHEDAAGDTKARRCAFGGPLRLGERVYERGLGVNSHSVLRVSLAQPAQRFLADIGLDRNVDNTVASVRFHVATGGRDLLATKVMRPGDGMQPIEVPLNGAREFELIVDTGGDERSFDQADWCDARVVLEDGQTLWLDDLATAGTPGVALPFSFVYGGKSSRDLLGSWRRTIQEDSSDATRHVRTVTFTDPESGLEVRAVCAVCLDTPGVDWTLHFTNTGTQDTPILEQIQALDVAIQPGIGAAAVLHRLNGGPSAADDWLPFDQAVPAGGKIDFAATNGRSSNVCPFFNLDWGSGGVITAIGWSGQWQASVARGSDGLQVRAGMQQLSLTLHPGESIRSPRIAQLYWTGADAARAHNLWRRMMFRHVLPKVNGKTATPPIAHLSDAFYEMNATNEANVFSHLEAVKGLGFEMFWLDAYFTHDGFPAGMGHYGFPIARAVALDRFPRGLQPIGEAAHAAGMGFLMWFEPERVAPKTELAKEHPEWVISPAQDGSGLFNLGLPEARQYMTEYLKAVVREYGLDCLRIDYNIDPLPFWQFANGLDPKRVGMTEIRYVEGLYAMWDELRAAYPHLLIDDCASGGRRIDLETASRSIPLWRTDATIDPLMRHDFNQAAIQNQVMTAGLSRYVPFSASGQMGASPYLFRSGFNAGISFAEDCRPKDYPRDLLRQAIAEGKRIRKYFFGDFYPLSDVTMSPKDWCVLQYHLEAEREGLLMAFRRHASPYRAFECEVRGLAPEKEYDVRVSRSYEPSESVRMKGSDLGHFSAEIDEKPGSLIIEYREVRE